MRWAPLLVALAACAARHDGALLEVTASACVACHRADYDATADPVHAGQLPTTCADCHVTSAWRPALAGGHPEDRFPIAGPPHDLACLSCHDLARGAATGGQNTDCIDCHLGAHTQAKVDPAHAGIAGYAFDPALPHFCLGCHPNGRALKHPESLFPITFGPHAGIACADCHDATLGSNAGGANANCTGCHTGVHARNVMDPRHREVGRYAWSDTNKQFCRACHPRGLGGG